MIITITKTLFDNSIISFLNTILIFIFNLPALSGKNENLKMFFLLA